MIAAVHILFWVCDFVWTREMWTVGKDKRSWFLDNYNLILILLLQVLDEIVWPMRQLNMKEEEFVCLKALAFLHPEAKVDC